MNKLTESFKEQLKPFVALICYKSLYSDIFYMERRDIKNNKMGCSKPLSLKFMSKLMKEIALKSEGFDQSVYGNVPSNLLWCDTRNERFKLIWYRSPEKRYMYFDKSLDIPNGEMEIPGILYCVDNDKLCIYCFKGKEPKNKLYRAPFMNTSSTYVCLGNAKLSMPENRTYQNIMMHWEDLFWKSEFLHILGDNPIKGNLSLITKDCIINKKKFPQDVLIEHTVKLSDLLK